MNTAKKWIALLLTCCLCLALIACGEAAKEEPAAQEEEQQEPVQETEPEEPTQETEPKEPVEEAEEPAPVDESLPVRVMTLNGTTGFGMAQLIQKAEAGEASLNYAFSVETDPSNVMAALVNGDCDIAALPTNAAAALYNKTGGAVQVLALNTLGVLYVVTDGTEEISSFADLDGKTVFVPAQNPTFIFQYLCKANGVNAVIDNTYAQPAELNAAVSAGEVSIAVLPEPMVPANSMGFWFLEMKSGEMMPSAYHLWNISMYSL